MFRGRLRGGGIFVGSVHGELGGIFFPQESINQLGLTIVTDGDDDSTTGFVSAGKDGTCCSWMAAICVWISSACSSRASLLASESFSIWSAISVSF